MFARGSFGGGGGGGGGVQGFRGHSPLSPLPESCLPPPIALTLPPLAFFSNEGLFANDFVATTNAEDLQKLINVVHCTRV